VPTCPSLGGREHVPMRSRLLLGLSGLSGLCGLLTVPLPAQAVWTVHAGGGAMFTAIQPAIAAAAPGDRIEVQGTGPYGSFVVDRGVEVESVLGALCGTIEVVGIPAGQRARVSGFVVDFQNQGHVSVRTCAGKVILAGLATSGSGSASSGARPGLEVLDAVAVLASHCNWNGHSDAISGAPGAMITNSQVAFVSGSAHGGYLLTPSLSAGDEGREGVVLVNSHVVADGVTWRGAQGGSGMVTGGDGGDAVFVQSGVAIVNGFSQLRGGFGGSGGTPGTQGHAARGNVRYGSETFLIGPTTGATSLPQRPVTQASGAVFVGTTATWSLAGVANQLVVLALDLDWTYAPVPAFDGALLLTANALLAAPIVLDAQGTGSFALAIPSQPALQHLDLFAQGLAFVGPALVLTGGTVTHTL
jgi:hypothetical protein